ncbi:Chloroperoxidase, partial [Leucosporidium creatinivorum]
ITIGLKAIPDAAHPFQNPPPGAQRGGCPGLNLLANYGYIDRSGVTDVGKLLFALQEGLGLAPDLAGFLVAISFRGLTDPTTLKMSIGRTTSATSGLLTSLLGAAAVPGPFSPESHNKFDHDGSLAFDDAYFTPGGYTDRSNGTLWAHRVALAKNEFGGLFGVDWVARTRYDEYKTCVQNNPECAWTVVTQLEFYAATCFTFLVMPTTLPDGSLGDPTVSVVDTFSGFKLQNGKYIKVPEKLPVGSDGIWRRRDVPLSLLEIVEAGLNSYLQYPVVFGSNDGSTNSFIVDSRQLNTENITPSAVICLLYNEIVENVPSSFGVLQDQVVALVNLLLAPAMVGLSC